MALLLFLSLGVPCHSNTPPLYFVPSHYQHSYIILSSGLGVLTTLNPLPANRLVISIFAIDCTKF